MRGPELSDALQLRRTESSIGPVQLCQARCQVWQQPAPQTRETRQPLALKRAVESVMATPTPTHRVLKWADWGLIALRAIIMVVACSTENFARDRNTMLRTSPRRLDSRKYLRVRALFRCS